MREIRTPNWSESFTLVPRNQIKCRAQRENPDLAVFGTSLGSPPAQIPGRCPSVLVTGYEGCAAGEMHLWGSLCRKAGLVPSDFHRNKNLSNPQGTLWAEGKCLLLELCQTVLHPKGTDGLLPAFQIPEKRNKSLQPFPFYPNDSQAFASYISFAFAQSWVIVWYLI